MPLEIHLDICVGGEAARLRSPSHSVCGRELGDRDSLTFVAESVTCAACRATELWLEYTE